MGTALLSMTAYNPAANEMVKRAHCSLKVALMAQCTNKNWKAQLPLVLLGLRTAPKVNGEESLAEKVYREDCQTHNYIPEGLVTCPHVFLRDNSHHPPLSRPCRGPYHIITRNSKAYLAEIHGRENWVSIDRLKPTFLMDNETWGKTSRHPRIPPQNKTLSEETDIPRQGRGRPRGRTKDGILAFLPDDSIVKTAPRPQISRTQGQLLIPT
ncbi:uncharacterized protein LOC135225314 [Macrobrachium nipponense]|uniref:uncharacterized protein LOC135225314 n=1 Tax=Macrobrachium nipponense TaxID=159736 RepID=UPI0030C83AE8